MPSLPLRPGPDPSSDDLIRIYLRRHLAAAGAGVALFRRVAKTAGRRFRTEVADIARDVEADRQALLSIASRYDADRPVLQELVGSVAQQLGRLNPTGTLTRRSPLADVIELEALGTAVQGKLLGFRTLRELAADDPRIDATEADELCERAQQQQERIEAMRLEAVRIAMAGPGEGAGLEPTP